MSLFQLIFLFLLSCNGNRENKPEHQSNQAATVSLDLQKNPWYSRKDTTILKVKDEEWKKVLSPELYAVAREKDTERPFTGKYWDSDERGTYYCAVCGNCLFQSDAKFSSHCGWPSFFKATRKNAVSYVEDKSLGMARIEVLCTRCQSHLGHIFDDGPPPTGKRFCMNSVSLDFEPFTKGK